MRKARRPSQNNRILGRVSCEESGGCQGGGERGRRWFSLWENGTGVVVALVMWVARVVYVWRCWCECVCDGERRTAGGWVVSIILLYTFCFSLGEGDMVFCWSQELAHRLSSAGLSSAWFVSIPAVM